MFSLVLTCSEHEAEFLCAELWEKGAAGIEETSLPGGRCQLRAYFENPEGLVEAFAAFHPRPEPVPDIDWDAVWRQAWQPFPVGKRLYLAPEWDESPTPPGRLRLVVHPGQALGTGAHPATRLCLEALDARLQPGHTLLDVGTGSGILAIAAALLGAGRVVALDVDPVAVRVAGENARANGVEGRVRVRRGEVADEPDAAYDLVLANITAGVLRELAPDLARVLRPEGTLALSGIVAPERGRVEEAFRARGLTPAGAAEREGWVLLAFRRP